MPLLNGMYIFVSEEQIANGVQVPEHPVEKGLNLTDYVRPNAMQLTLTGEIVGDNATDTVEKIKKIQRAGAFVDYSGCNLVENAIISDFSTGNTNEIAGGYSFSMTIREIRIAGSPYNASDNLQLNPTGTAGVQQVQSEGKQERYHTVKAGESRWSISEQYKSNGCTIDFLTQNNNNSDCLKQVGNWYTLKVGAKVKIGNW